MTHSIRRSSFVVGAGFVLLTCCAQAACGEIICPREGYGPFTVRVSPSVSNVGADDATHEAARTDDAAHSHSWNVDPTDGYHGWWHLTARVYPCHSYRVEVCASTKAAALEFANRAMEKRRFSRKEEFSVLGAALDDECKLGGVAGEMW